MCNAKGNESKRAEIKERKRPIKNSERTIANFGLCSCTKKKKFYLSLPNLWEIYLFWKSNFFSKTKAHLASGSQILINVKTAFLVYIWPCKGKTTLSFLKQFGQFERSDITYTVLDVKNKLACFTPRRHFARFRLTNRTKLSYTQAMLMRLIYIYNRRWIELLTSSCQTF